MSESWGGYRAPSNPAVVSGPGANSARTDGGVMNPNSPAYGEVADVQNLTAAAPLAGTPGAAAQGGAPAGVDLSAIVGLGAPSQDPGLPVTAGAAAGDGPGLEVLGLPQDPVAERRQDVKSISPAQLQVLLARASEPDATPSFKRLVRQVVANL